MTHPFQDVLNVLNDAKHGRNAPLDGPLLSQLTTLGLVSPVWDSRAAPGSLPEARPGAHTGPTKLALTADGKDVLDALRSPPRWAEVEEAAARQGLELTLETLKAAVAASISGGFNA